MTVKPKKSGLLAAGLTRKALDYPAVTLGLAAVLSLMSLIYLITHMTIRTDIDSLISKDLPWRQAESVLEKAFPAQGDDLTLVIDAKTPEMAEAFADQMAEKLQVHKDLFALVSRPSGGSYLKTEALMFLKSDEVVSLTDHLVAAAPLLGPLAADPSLRGLLRTLDQGLDGLNEDPARFETMRPLFLALEQAFAAQIPMVRETSPKAASQLSWRNLIAHLSQASSSEGFLSPGGRALISLTPRADYHKLDPAQAFKITIAAAKTEVFKTRNFPTDINIRLTGSVAMQSDELANLQEAIGPISMICLILTGLILYISLRSFRSVMAVLLTVLIGLIVTAAFGLYVFQSFNLISLAFLPLFVGLGIDFAVQFALRYRFLDAVEAKDEPLVMAANIAGSGIFLASLATSFGFLAFTPTPYKGVSELGLIAGFGMLIGGGLSLTVLPAFMAWFQARPSPQDWLLPYFIEIQNFSHRKSRKILGVFALGLGFSGLALAGLKTDFDLIHLRRASDVSVSTFRELSADPDLTPNRLELLAKGPEAAKALIARLQKMPEVRDIYSLYSLIPQDQNTKLTAIRNAAFFLSPILSPFDVASPPQDQDIKAALNHTATALEKAAANPHINPKDAGLLNRFADHCLSLAKASPQIRAAAVKALTENLDLTLEDIRKSLEAEPITENRLPVDLLRAFVSPDGLYRIEVTPSGDVQDLSNLKHFIAAVRKIAPQASGPPISMIEAGETILKAFITAGILASLSISVMLFLILKRASDVVLTLGPVALVLTLTLASLALLQQPMNLENLIGLPLLLGIGVSFNIYAVIFWRKDVTLKVQAGLNYAIFFSALTTGASFLALALSAHPGTSSLGLILLMTLFWSLVEVLLFQPALLNSLKK